MSIYLYLISIALMVLLTQLYFSSRKDYKDNSKALALKASCTLIPVLLCFYALFKTNAPMKSWLLFVGLFLCMAADIIIGLRFDFGMLVFLAAHLCFIAYYLTLAPFSRVSVLLFLAFFAGAAVVFRRFLKGPYKRLLPFALYAVALMLMFSVAAALPVHLQNPGTVCIAMGAGLFVISDSLLAENTFGTPNRIRDRFVMYLYYPAVYLLAVSAFYI